MCKGHSPQLQLAPPKRLGVKQCPQSIMQREKRDARVIGVGKVGNGEEMLLTITGRRIRRHDERGMYMNLRGSTLKASLMVMMMHGDAVRVADCLLIPNVSFHARDSLADMAQLIANLSNVLFDLLPQLAKGFQNALSGSICSARNCIRLRNNVDRVRNIGLCLLFRRLANADNNFSIVVRQFNIQL